jgi:hypothetical protein
MTYEKPLPSPAAWAIAFATPNNERRNVRDLDG